MFKGLAESLLLPPMFLLLLGLLGLLIERRSRRVGRILTWTGMLGLLLLAVPAVGNLLLIALEQDLPLKPPPDAPPQAIVILGGDITRGGTNTVILRPGLLSLERERTGALLYRRTHLPILISGGPLRGDATPLSVVMADSMEHDFQVPTEWMETESRDTWENAQDSAEILRTHGITSVYVVTQAWHMRRAILAFAHTGIKVTAAPTRLDRAFQGPLLSDLTPATDGWRNSFFAMHEWVGCAYYALR